MAFSILPVGDDVVISDCREIHPELKHGTQGRIVGEPDDNGHCLVDFWFTRKRIPPSAIIKHIPRIPIPSVIAESPLQGNGDVLLYRIDMAKHALDYYRNNKVDRALTDAINFLDMEK